MRIFLRVADLSSFSGAADALHLPKASVSAAVRQLEQTTGTRLLERTTRRVALTPDGQLFYGRCRELVDDLEDVESMFRPSHELSGNLRVDMSIGLAKHLVVPALPEFLALHPHLQIDLCSTDRFVDLVQEGFDCVLRVGSTPEEARLLTRLSVVNCASPAYLERCGTPQVLADLAGHQLIHYADRNFGFEHSQGHLSMTGALLVNNSEAYLAACLAGLGIIQGPAYSLHPYIRRGELVEVLPEHRAEPMPLWLLTPPRRKPSRRVRAFSEWVARLVGNPPRVDNPGAHAALF